MEQLDASYQLSIHSKRVLPKIGVGLKMDGENNGSNPMNKWDDLGGKKKKLFLVQHPKSRVINTNRANWGA